MTSRHAPQEPLSRRTFLAGLAAGLVIVTAGGDAIGNALRHGNHAASSRAGDQLARNAYHTLESRISSDARNADDSVPWNINPFEPTYARLCEQYAVEAQNLTADQEATRQAISDMMRVAVAKSPPVVRAVDRTHADFAPTQDWFGGNELVLSWMCCYDTNPKTSRVFANVSLQNPYAVFMLGDNGYPDGDIRINKGVRPPLYFTPRTADESALVQAYFTNSFLRVARGADFTRLKTTSMIYAVQDDHDYLADGQDLFSVDPKTHALELSVHSASLEPARRAFGSVFTQIGTYPKPTYFSIDIGAGTQVTMLNAREYAYNHKYENVFGTSFPAFLGPNQWAWFRDVIQEAPNNNHLICLPVSPTFSRQAAGDNQITQASRNRFYNFLHSFPNKKFVVLTGDRHALGIAQFGNVTELLAAPSGTQTFHAVNLSDASIADRLWSNGTNTGDPSMRTHAFGIARLTPDGGLQVEFRRSADGSTVDTPYCDANGQIRIW